MESATSGAAEAPLPLAGGSYVLLGEAAGAARVQVGRFGVLELRPGWYAYVGSAHGAGGVRARVERHLRREKALRWHMDYLRPHLRLHVVWYATGARRCESLWAEALARLPGAEVPLRGFGATDTADASHLFAFARAPELRDFRAAVGAGEAGCAEIGQWRPSAD